MNIKSKAKLSHVNIYQYQNNVADISPGHPYLKLIYFQKGKGQIRMQDEYYHVETDDLVVIQPSRKRFSINVEEPLTFIVLGVENLYIDELSVSGQMCRIHLDSNEFRQNLHSILNELSVKAEQYEYACNYYLQLLLIELERTNGLYFRSPVKEKKSRDCKFIKDYLDEHFTENINLDTLSEQSNMNKYYLVHSFTKAFGCSPINYLNEKRIEESKRLLETTDASIAEIARVTGFSSQSYFSQAFKKNTFMTPNEYRRSAKN